MSPVRLLLCAVDFQRLWGDELGSFCFPIPFLGLLGNNGQGGATAAGWFVEWSLAHARNGKL
jgi:hypothetical protein